MSNPLLIRRRAMMSSDSRPKYLMFTALEDSCTIGINEIGGPKNIHTQYSLNKGEFQSYTYGTTISLNEGDTVEWRREPGYETTQFGTYWNNYYHFVKSGNIQGSGYITSLLNSEIDVASIGNYTFYYTFANIGCELLLPNTVSSLGTNCFYGCSKLTGNIFIPSMANIPEGIYRGCSGLTGDLMIPDGVVTIGNTAFSGCSGLNGLFKLPNTLTTIGESSFSGVGITDNLVIPNSITSIRQSAFSNSNKFTGNLVIPDSVATMENYAFQGCTGLTGTLTIQSQITSIPFGAFEYCKFTGVVTIPSTVTSINTRAFGSVSTISAFICLPTTPPTLGAANTSLGAATIKIYVPWSADHSILAAYQSASVWSDIASRIFELDENGDIPS